MPSSPVCPAESVSRRLVRRP